MTTERAEAATEVWVIRHGLPYFVESQRRVAARGLTRARLVPALSAALGLGAAAGCSSGGSPATRPPACPPGSP